MTNQSTMDKLIEMRLTAMADAFRSQLDDPKFKEIPFEDQFGMLVDIEYRSRKNNRLKRLIKNAEYSCGSKSQIRKFGNRSSGTRKSSFLCLITVPFLWEYLSRPCRICGA